MLEIIDDLRKQHMKKNDKAILHYMIVNYPMCTDIENIYIVSNRTRQNYHLNKMIKTMTHL